MVNSILTKKAVKSTVIVLMCFICVSCNNNNEPTVYTSYAGSWKCDETSSISGYSKPYMVIIDKSQTDTTQYIIRNFFNTGNNQMIIIEIDNNEIELLQQPTSGQILQSFSGEYTPYSRIKITYTMYDGERDVFFEALYTRK